MKHDPILELGVRLALPFIIIFALYVHFHGDYGPGGGFQAGAIIATGVIMHVVIFGLEKTQRLVPPSVVEPAIGMGVLIYIASGLPGMLFGAGFLDYSIFGNDHLHAHEWGIFAVEIGVIVTVCSTLIAIFYAFAGRAKS